MRKLWVKAWITLDSVFDAATMNHWWQNTNSPERMQYITQEYSKGDVYLLGRVTYEMLWPGWSKQTTGDGPGPILNRMHKYVVSTTLTEAPWKESTIISENVVEEIAKLKRQPGKDIIVDGSATLVRTLRRRSVRPRRVLSAVDAGYLEQAHIHRDFRELIGLTPRTAARVPRFHSSNTLAAALATLWRWCREQPASPLLSIRPSARRRRM